MTRPGGRGLILLAPFFILLLCGGLRAEETGARLGGYLRNFFVAADGADGSTWEALFRLRLKLDISTSDSVMWEFAYEAIPRLREKGAGLTDVAVAQPGLFSYRAYDLEETLYPRDEGPEDTLVLTQNLDRAFVTLRGRSLDVFVGRQPVAFGSARVINPTDIITPYTYNTLAKEERVGVDAVRAKTPLGRLGEVDAGVVFGDEFKAGESAAFLRTRSYLSGTDFTLMAMYFRENLLLGLDMSRSIGGAGAWLEAAHVFSENGQQEDYARLSAGADYSFTGKLYAYMEYHYNGAGAGRPGKYLDAINETAFTEGAVYLLGRHYLAPGLTYQLTPLFLLTAQAIINLDDGSVLFSPILEYSLAEDVFLGLGGYAGLGEESPDPLLPESEFGLYPDIYFASLNIYF